MLDNNEIMSANVSEAVEEVLQMKIKRSSCHKCLRIKSKVGWIHPDWLSLIGLGSSNTAMKTAENFIF